MAAYYNEIDPYCCQWLRNLIEAGHLPKGDVDERDIREVQSDDLRGYTQAHFFAGIGGWPYALRLAGWPDDRPVWTGSCPCQPFSAAGKGQASGDERHLWPAWFRLIRSCRPMRIFGEQVEAAIGWGWLDLVYSDLEAEGYSVGAAVLPACSVGAPHIRQRLWFVAESSIARTGRNARSISGEESTSRWRHGSVGACGADDELAHSNGGHASAEWLQRGGEQRCESQDGRVDAVAHATSEQVGLPRQPRSMGHANGAGRQERTRHARNDGETFVPARRQTSEQASPWSNLQWLTCTDGKQRPTQSGIFPLAHGVPARVAKLRAAGNAICPQVAAEFIKACGDA